MKIYLSDIANTKKPSTTTIKKISKTMLSNLVDLELPSLAHEIAVNGKTVVLAELAEHKLSKTTPIVSQELVMLDFDNKNHFNKYTLDDLFKDPFMLKNACFLYRTFGDMASKADKFRVVFRLSKPLKKVEDVEKVYKELFKLYPQSDHTIGQTTRMFFGGNQGYTEIDFKNKLSVSTLYAETLPLVTGQNNEVEIFDLNTPVYELFRAKRYELIKEKLGTKYQQEFPDDFSAMTYFKSVDMTELLELPKESPFLDVLHPEKNPSASVYFAEDLNVYFYKCFSENALFTGDIAIFLAKLTGTGSKARALKTLVDVTNSSINNTSALGIHKLESHYFRKELLSGELKKTYPELYDYLKRYKSEINATLDIMYDYTYSDSVTKEVKYMNYMTVETLQKHVTSALGRPISRGKMWNILNIIVVTEMIQKIPQGKIPKDLFDSLIKKQLEEANRLRTSNVYTPSDLSVEQMKHMTSIAKVLKDNNVPVGGLSYDLVYRLFGEEKAKRDFQQAYEPLKKRKLVTMSKEDGNLTKDSKKLESQAVGIIKKRLDKQGYIFEKDLVTNLAKTRKEKFITTSKKYYKIRADVMITYGLTRCSTTKKIHKDLKIKEKYSNKIVIFKAE